MPPRVAGPLLQVATWLASVERAALESGNAALSEAEDTLSAAMDGEAVGLAGRALENAVRAGDLPHPPLAGLLEAVRMSVEARPPVTIDDLLDFGYRALGSVGWLVAHLAGARSAEVVRYARDSFTALYLLEQSGRPIELGACASARARELLSVGWISFGAEGRDVEAAFAELVEEVTSTG